MNNGMTMGVAMRRRTRAAVTMATPVDESMPYMMMPIGGSITTHYNAAVGEAEGRSLDR